MSDRKRDRQRETHGRAALRQAQQKRARDKGHAVRDALRDFRDVAGQGVPYTRRTKGGLVSLRRISVDTDPNGVTVINVLVDEPMGGDPHFRIINPPVLVEDPTGTQTTTDGRRVKADPLAALAEVIAQHGGAQVEGRRRGR